MHCLLLCAGGLPAAGHVDIPCLVSGITQNCCTALDWFFFPPFHCWPGLQERITTNPSITTPCLGADFVELSSLPAIDYATMQVRGLQEFCLLLCGSAGALPAAVWSAWGGESMYLYTCISCMMHPCPACAWCLAPETPAARGLLPCSSAPTRHLLYRLSLCLSLTQLQACSASCTHALGKSIIHFISVYLSLVIML